LVERSSEGQPISRVHLLDVDHGVVGVELLGLLLAEVVAVEFGLRDDILDDLVEAFSLCFKKVRTRSSSLIFSFLGLKPIFLRKNFKLV
jgi:hypothetical protein